MTPHVTPKPRFGIIDIRVIEWKVSEKILNGWEMPKEYGIGIGWRAEVVGNRLKVWMFVGGTEGRSGKLYFNLEVMVNFWIASNYHDLKKKHSISDQKIEPILETFYATLRGILFEKSKSSFGFGVILPALNSAFIVRALKLRPTSLNKAKGGHSLTREFY